RECWRLTTRSGRTIVATDNHPFLKVGGWTPLSELEVGDRIAVPREVPVFGECDWSSERIRLLAYFIAEGGLTGRMPRFTNADPVIVDDFERCVYEEFESCAVTNIGITYTVRYIGDRFRGCNDVTAWLKSLELMGKSALEKRFPDVVWTFSREQLVDFVRVVMSCDGTVYPLRGYARIEFAVASENLARDMHHALIRLGIVSKFWFKKERCWRVEITEPASVDRYQREIGWLGEKTQRRFSERPGGRALRSNIGAPPAEVWELVRKALDNAGMSFAELSRRCGENSSNPHTRRSLPQRRLAMYAEVLDDDDLRFLAKPDLYWDEVVSIGYDGERDVYDLTVPMGSNFIADDICVHNSSLLSDFALAAGKRTQPVVLFSLEMSRQEVVQRFLSSE
ncbi:MAG: intein-containing replicative DNA helicase, partial [Actinobacteria bacterium]|nr:intein-containing replicative DNA helicase [Actinomycetota bacterium]